MDKLDPDRTRQLCCLMHSATGRLTCWFCGVGFCEECAYHMKFGFGGRVAHSDCAKKFAKPISVTEFQRIQKEESQAEMLRKSRKK